MPLRLTTIRGPSSVTVKADGILDGEHLAEFRKVCHASTLPLQLDLSDLRRADEQGARELKEMEEAGVVLMEVRPFVRMLIDSAT